MDLATAMSSLRNICVNTNNQEIFDVINKKVEQIPSSDSWKQAESISNLITTIRREATYLGQDVSDIMKEMGAETFKINENSSVQIVGICKIRRKTFQIKVLHPTDRYVIGGGPWKVSPTVYTDSAQKEAKKLQAHLTSHYPYKKLTLDLDEFLVEGAKTH